MVGKQHVEPLIPTDGIVSKEPLYAVEIYPQFRTEQPNTTLVLSSQRDHPIRLSNVFASDQQSTVAQYPFTFLETEAFVTPLGLKFTPDGSHFLAGGHSRIGFFDVSRPYQGPVEIIRTGPRRGKNALLGTFKGLVSSLSVSDEGLLAAGTYSRRVGLYTTGQRNAIMTFELTGHEKDDEGKIDIGGSGVSQCSWSPCGKYLYVAERNSDGLIMYDIRAGKKLGLMIARKANTFQRMGFEVVGNHIWAGGTDGAARTWAWPHVYGGIVAPSGEWHMHYDTITSITMRPLGDAFATCCGSRDLFKDVANNSDIDSDSSEGTSSDGIASGTERESADESISITSESIASGENTLAQTRDYSLKLWAVSDNKDREQSVNLHCERCRKATIKM